MPEVAGDSRLILLQYVKDNPLKKFVMFNYHYYFMPEDFLSLKNVSYFEKIVELNKITRDRDAQYLVYFQENGGYNQYVEKSAVIDHKSAMRLFSQYPLFFEIKGRDKNIFGDTGPQLNPTVMIKKLYD